MSSEEGDFGPLFEHSPQSNCEIALSYARRGLPVIPLHSIVDGVCTCGEGAKCKSPGKHPIGSLAPNGVKDATTDETTIKRRWERFPNANIGTPVGPSHHKIAIDVESEKGHGVDGHSNWKTLQEAHGFIPQTLSWSTGSGGFNAILTLPLTVTHAKTVDIAPGVSIRASDGQYVVLPPSSHTLGVYTIIDDREPAEAPQWIIDTVAGNGRGVAGESAKRSNGNQNSKLPEIAYPGQRHSAIISLAGKLLSRGVDYEAAVERCLAFNRDCCKPSKTDQEVLADVLDVYSRYEPGTSFQIDGARQYIVKDGAYVRVHTKDRYGRADRVEARLCNFTARIVKETIKDDGAELTHYYIIAGKTAKGQDLPPIEVPADKFDSMQWISQWGVDAIVEAGYGLKDHLRAAIKYHSLGAERQSVYTHIGWRIIGNEYLFLHAGGAIGKNGSVPDISVEVGDSRLRHYRLPDPLLRESEELKRTIGEVIHLLDCKLAPDVLIFPLVAAVFRAPLSECFGVDFSPFLTGRTGSLKTTLYALGQSFFGSEFSTFTLPGNWVSTANALERLAFQAKDVFFVVDDYNPRGSPREVRELNDKADRVLRGQANKGGRNRQRTDGSLRPVYYPRGIVATTGEDVPTGESLRGRLFHQKAQKGLIDLQELSHAQERAADGNYAAATSAYVQWLAPRMGELRRTLEKEQNRRRDRFAQLMRERNISGVHPRMATTLASLSVGFEMWLQSALECKAITADNYEKLRARCDDALLEAARDQAEFIETEDPSEQACELLRAVFTMGFGHVTSAEDDGILSEDDNPRAWGYRSYQASYDVDGKRFAEYAQPQGHKIGWKRRDTIMLDPSSAYTAIQRVARERGSNMALTERTMWKHLIERGLAARERHKIAGTQRRVIIISAHAIWDAKEEQQ